MKKTTDRPVFKVIVESMSRNSIEFVNWFEYAQWEVIRKELKKVARKFSKIVDAPLKDIRKAVKDKLWTDKFRVIRSTLVRDVVAFKLDRLCAYYFWSKCEHEVVVSGWPNGKNERKIDVYEQLKANWGVFCGIVFNELGI